MSTFGAIYGDAIRQPDDESSLLFLLKTYGNRLFDPFPSNRADVIAAARFFRDCPLAGPVYDIGAGEGAAALLLARLLRRTVVAVEIVERRAERIAARARRFGLCNLEVRTGDAFAANLADAAGLYVFTPFFDADSAHFARKVARECRPGTRIVGVSVVVRALRQCRGLREIGRRRGSFRYAEMEVAAAPSQPSKRSE